MFVNLIKYILLGIIQGFTEPIPVSSSGHLMVFRTLITDRTIGDFNFEIIVNFGSLIAIVLFFRKDIIALVKDFFLYIQTKEKAYQANYRYCWLLVLGTIPAGIVGLLLKDWIETALTSVKYIGATLLITAGFLALIRNIKGSKHDQDITFKDALVIGTFQVFALFPGISRSGSTIVGGMFRDLKRDTAFKFSFMLYIPISLATMVLGVSDLINSSLALEYWIYYGIGMVVSGFVTYFATKWFVNVLKKGKLIYFVYYCIIAGILILAFL